MTWVRFLGWVSVNEINIALWEPDITPPENWLLPSILYQDRISTFAPLSVSDRDGLEAEKLRSALGNLYEPLSLLDALSPPAQSVLLDYLYNRMPIWVSQTERLLDRTGDEKLQAWLRRTKGWPTRKFNLRRMIDEVSEEIRVARERKRARNERLILLDAEVGQLSVKVANMRSALRSEFQREKEIEYASLAAALQRRVALGRKNARDRRRSPDPHRDEEVRKANAELKEIRRSLELPPPSPERQEYEAACIELANAISAMKAAKQELDSSARELNDAIESSRRIEENNRRPWHGDSHFDVWLRPERLAREVPRFLDTIGPGKIYSDVFEFLATEAGMWVSEPAARDASYAGTLVGPKWVVADVLSILAAWHCDSHIGWVQMSSADRPLERVDRELRTPDEIITLGIRWVLPAPARATLTEVRDFRITHEEELRLVRSALSAALPDLRTIDELSEAVRAMKEKVAEPLAEIERALRFERSFALGKTQQTLLYRAEKGLRNIVAGIAAAGVAAPLLGNTISGTGIAAAAGGGAILTLSGLAAKDAYSALAWRRFNAKVEGSPYKYLYDVGRRFDFNSE
jgi:hypothetical protein